MNTATTIEAIIEAGTNELRSTFPCTLPKVVRWMTERAIEQETVEMSEDRGLRAQWAGRFTGQNERRLITELQAAAERKVGKVRKPGKMGGPYFCYEFSQEIGDTTRVYQVSCSGKISLEVFEI